MPYLGISAHQSVQTVETTVCAPIITSGSFGQFFSKLRQVANQVQSKHSQEERRCSVCTCCLAKISSFSLSDWLAGWLAEWNVVGAAPLAGSSALHWLGLLRNKNASDRVSQSTVVRGSTTANRRRSTGVNKPAEPDAMQSLATPPQSVPALHHKFSLPQSGDGWWGNWNIFLAYNDKSDIESLNTEHSPQYEEKVKKKVFLALCCMEVLPKGTPTPTSHHWRKVNGSLTWHV